MDMHRFGYSPSSAAISPRCHTPASHLMLAFGQRILPTRQFHGNIGGQIQPPVATAAISSSTTAFRGETARAGVQRLFHQRCVNIVNRYDRRHPFGSWLSSPVRKYPASKTIHTCTPRPGNLPTPCARNQTQRPPESGSSPSSCAKPERRYAVVDKGNGDRVVLVPMDRKTRLP